jgi:hypothetical protein
MADLADLVIELISPDLNPDPGDISAFNITATNERAAATLRMLLGRDRELTTGRDGRKFILLFLTQEAVDNLAWHAGLAGLTVERAEPRGSSDPETGSPPRRRWA